jgi:hypothetical protein
MGYKRAPIAAKGDLGEDAIRRVMHVPRNRFPNLSGRPGN